MAGAKLATGDVLVVMDSHCECGTDWLQPLLNPIARNYKTVTCPFIDVIDMNTFEVRPQDDGRRGSFDWNSFHYKRRPDVVAPRKETGRQQDANEELDIGD